MKPHILIAIAAVFFTIPPMLAQAETNPDSTVRNEVITVLKDNPGLILKALKGHEEELYDLMQIGLEKKNKAKIRERQIKQLSTPYMPLLMVGRPVWGNPNGDISIFAYSDFQSASCLKADKTVQELLKADPNVNYHYRHNPQGFHRMSRPAAQYYEALARQNTQKAIAFKDMLFTSQSKINKTGLKELDGLVLKIGGDLARLHKDINSDQVNSIIARDVNEAKKFGFTASPVFIINGLTVTGAAPLSEFQEVIKLIRDHKSK
ncbi:DsbA family protein [Desulfovibrio gilichinskyi]|uniref:Thiol:disulfide interchange protein DsbA n=1 Tax=Desulfovibrio gilichinskyi TaxID=1519643 RepID=A0A1X7EMI9_9BACT|nr:thioredoxin domain-containing protein [Desulfovibrio gilichinskyi]SMF36662.1 Thiol:disulfide interchange protein DsbA [Desulfovibrio gilichinskyi]